MGLRGCVLAAALVVVAGCGDGKGAPTAPTAPSAPAFSLTGNWSGTYSQLIDGQRDTFRITAALTQSGTQLAGTLEGGTSYRGVITGSMSTPNADATVSGTLQIDAPASDGTSRCTGTATFTGSVSPILALRSAALAIEACAGAVTDIQIDLVR